MQKNSSQKGFFLIEVVVASSVIAVVLILLLGSIQDMVEVSQRSLERTKASFLIEEGAEAVKSIRDDSWTTISALSTDTPYYLSWNGSQWTLSTTASSIDQYTRTIVFSTVSRDSNDDIVSSGGTLDTDAKKAAITVSWTVPSGTQTEDTQFYIFNIR
jgi:type II secretory pathway pseudopilin PulG